jgi:BirA family biotin operon repressor/biotin-[acetyl-CoA-carboxylase] ligase
MPAEAVTAIDQPWTDLHALLDSQTPSRAVVAVAVLAALAEAQETFDAQGLTPFLPRFAALDALREAEVVAIDGERETAGIACGVDADGALRLRTAAGEIALRAGELSVRKTRRGTGPHTQRPHSDAPDRA